MLVHSRPAGIPLRQFVADSIRWMINAGELLPGARIPEEQIAAELGVSRNPVREGLRILEGIGLVEVTPQKGARVASLDAARAVELIEMRTVLESYASEQAAIHRTDDDVALLRRIYAAGAAAVAGNCLADVAENHTRLHDTIHRAAGNSYLPFLMTPLGVQTELLQSLGRRSVGPMDWAEHLAIVDAIEGRDPALARKLAEHHLVNLLSAFRDLAARAAASR